jgi:hypothetical protein
VDDRNVQGVLLERLVSGVDRRLGFQEQLGDLLAVLETAKNEFS